MGTRKLLIFLIISLSMGEAVFAQPAITGTVKDAKGVPIVGASVLPRDATKGVATDSLGQFTIKTSPGGTLLLSAVGYADTAIAINYRRALTIVMRQKTSTLGKVTVSPTSPQNQGPTLADQINGDRNIANALDDYARSEQLGEGNKVYSGVTGKSSTYNLITTGSMGNTNYGAMMPVLHQPLETKGSRFLMSDWSNGLVENQYDTIINNPSYLFNFDKITGDLMMTQDKQTYIDIDHSQVKSFALKNSSGGYYFSRAPEISPDKYYQIIGQGDKYAIYKSIKTKLVKADGQSNGLTSVGNDYDEYVDEFVYYFVDLKTQAVKTFELKKKSIKDAMEVEKDKTDRYLTEHKRDDIDDKFLRGLILFLNA